MKTFVMKMKRDSEVTVDISYKGVRGRIPFHVLKNFSIIEVTLKKKFQKLISKQGYCILTNGEKKKLVFLKNVEGSTIECFKKNVSYPLNVNCKILLSLYFNFFGYT